MTPSTGSTALTVSELPPDEDQDEDEYSDDEPPDDAENDYNAPPEIRFSLDPELSPEHEYQSRLGPSPSPSPTYDTPRHPSNFHTAPAILGGPSTQPEGSRVSLIVCPSRICDYSHLMPTAPRPRNTLLLWILGP